MKYLKIGILAIVLKLTILCIGTAQGIEELKTKLDPNYGEWKLSDKFQVFDSENLYDYINGAADNYISYDFNQLLVATYEINPENYITVEIYAHKALAQAFGIYIAERPINAKLEKIGIQGYQEEGVLNFFVGNYYLKLSTHNKEKSTAVVLKSIAESFSGKLDSDAQFPKALSFFPELNKIVNSESFSNSNFLGHEFLSSAYICNYGKEGKSFKIFIMELSSPEEAKNALVQYVKYTKQNFTGNEGVYTIKDPHNGEIKLEWKGKYIWGILNEQKLKIKEDYIQLVRDLIEKNI